MDTDGGVNRLLFAATTAMAALHVSRSRGNSDRHDPAMEVAV